MRNNKYNYIKVLEEYGENGWYDSVTYDMNDPSQMKDLKADLRSYRNEGIRVRVVTRRVLNENR